MDDDVLRRGFVTLAAELANFASAREWERFHSPKNLAMSLAIEAAEVMEHFQWTPAEPRVELEDARRRAIGHELADVLVYLVRLATVLEIDLSSAVREKMAINELRYPVALARGRAAKYDEL